jgi:hypothetical protein
MDAGSQNLQTQPSSGKEPDQLFDVRELSGQETNGLAIRLINAVAASDPKHGETRVTTNRDPRRVEALPIDTRPPAGVAELAGGVATIG